MKTFKQLILVEAKPNKKDITSDAKELAYSIMDDIIYRVKDYFGDWPEDVIGQEMSDHFYKVLYKEIAKLARSK